MSERLLPCPFCGADSNNELGPAPNWGIREGRGQVWFIVCCCNTGPQTNDYGTVEEATAMWNRRATPESESSPASDTRP